jgi:hypothetical protein
MISVKALAIATGPADQWAHNLMRLLFPFGRQAKATGPVLSAATVHDLPIMRMMSPCLTLPLRQACTMLTSTSGVHMGLKKPFGRCCCTCMAGSPCAEPACQKEPQWTHTSQHHLGLVCWTPSWQTWLCWSAAQAVLLLGQSPADQSCLKPGMHHLASSSQPCKKDNLLLCRVQNVCVECL